jgi:hypothetical protein
VFDKIGFMRRYPRRSRAGLVPGMKQKENLVELSNYARGNRRHRQPSIAAVFITKC